MIQLVSFYTEKKPRSGEDAPPIAASLRTGEYLLGVFDGLGGSGGRQFMVNTAISSSETPNTGAYLASRFIKDEVLKYFKSNQINSLDFFTNISLGVQNLQKRLTINLTDYLSRLERTNPPLRLRSSMLKSLPTTMAICYIAKKGVFIWAGDSRGYILYGEGLCQYTKDELESKGDALDNLREDSLMSNCICETGFTLQHKIFPLRNHSIIITATDGCFGYLKTPMHFEYLLLSCMQESSSLKQWEDKLSSNISDVSGDDATMSLLCIGEKWSDFSSMKNHFKPRFDLLVKQYINPIDEAAEEDREGVIKKLWHEYKKTYDKTVTENNSQSPLPSSSNNQSVHTAVGQECQGAKKPEQNSTSQNSAHTNLGHNNITAGHNTGKSDIAEEQAEKGGSNNGKKI